ncbi:hypothetical protein D3C72_1572040 [compost metagenome]
MLGVEFFHFLVACAGIFPRRIVFIFKEKCAVARVFRIDIQLTRRDRAAHDGRCTKLHFIDRFNAVAFKNLKNNIAEQSPFGIDFRSDFYRLSRLQGQA